MNQHSLMIYFDFHKMHYNNFQNFEKKVLTVNRVNVDLKNLLGFRIVANQVKSIKSLKIGAKLGSKPGFKPSPKPEAKNS